MPSIVTKAKAAVRAITTSLPAPDLAEATRIAGSIIKVQEDARTVDARIAASPGSMLLRQREAAFAAERHASAEDAKFGNQYTRAARARAEEALVAAEEKHQAQAPLDRGYVQLRTDLSREAGRLADAGRAALTEACSPTLAALEAELGDLATRYASTFRIFRTLLGGHIGPSTAIPLASGYSLHISDAELLPEHRALVDAVEPVLRLIRQGETIAGHGRQDVPVAQPLQAAG